MKKEKPKLIGLNIVWSLCVFIATFCAHTFCFPPYDIAELAYFIPVAAVLWLFYQAPSRKLFMWSVGAGFWLSWVVLISWLRHVTWIGWIGLSSIITLFPLAWAMMVWWFVPRFKDRGLGMRLLGIGAVCSVWVLVEFVRTFFFTGFPWLTLAASQWQRPVMLQTASLTGAYGVSFMLMMVGMILAFYLRHLFQGKKKGWSRFCPEFLLGMTVWLGLTFGGLQFHSPRGERTELFKAALIQPYIPQSDKWDNSKSPEMLGVFEKQIKFQSRIGGADVAIFPEASLPYPLLGYAEMQKWTEDLADEFNAPLLFGALAVENRGTDEERMYNSVLAVYPDTGLDEQDYYSKQHLVPYGEYIPFRRVMPFISKIVPINSDIIPGESSKPYRLKIADTELPLGMLICYEDAYPNLASETVKRGARALIVATNGAWYGEEGQAYQHAALSVLRAVETRRPVVRVGNGGWSGWIDEFGVIRDVVANEEGSVYVRGSQIITVDCDLTTNREYSFFVRWGNWFVGLCAFIVFVFYYLLQRDFTDSEEDKWDELLKSKDGDSVSSKLENSL